MPSGPIAGILHGDPANLVSPQGGDNQLLNPLAIGVTLGGQLLDIAVPRPKPRYGHAHEYLSPLNARRNEDRRSGQDRRRARGTAGRERQSLVGAL